MFLYPYDTTVCSDYITNTIIKEIKTASVTEGLTEEIDYKGRDQILSISPESRNIALITSNNKEVPHFAHPIMVELNGGNKIVIDARSYTRVSKVDGPTVSNETEYKFNFLRALLMNHMIEESPKDLLGLGSFPMLIYSRWIAENITKRMGLNPADQQKLVVITAFFYNSLFRNDKILNENELNKLAQTISTITYVPISNCFEIADQILPMTNVKEYVTQVVNLINNSRLEKFSTGILYTILMNSWFGANAREIVSVSLEHMPTWFALMYTAINDRGYRNANISKVVLANDKKEAGKNFTVNLLHLIS